MLDSENLVVIVTCINTKDITDIETSIEGFFDSFGTAHAKTRELTSQNCKNSLLYKTMIEYLQDIKKCSYNQAVKFFDQRYIISPLITVVPTVSNSVH